MSREEVLEKAVQAVKFAASFTDNVEFSAEDGSRSDPDFLCKVFEAVIDAGATTVNLPDTVGYAVPEEFGKLVAHVMENTPNTDKAVLSVHCNEAILRSAEVFSLKYLHISSGTSVYPHASVHLTINDRMVKGSTY